MVPLVTLSSILEPLEELLEEPPGTPNNPQGPLDMEATDRVRDHLHLEVLAMDPMSARDTMCQHLDKEGPILDIR